MARKWSDRICASVLTPRWNVFQEDWIVLKKKWRGGRRWRKGWQNHSLHWFQRTGEREWLPSMVLRANKDFSAVVPTTRDKCLTEGYSPSCGILMICSRHPPISLVVHEALWHTRRPGPSVRAQPYVFLQVTIMSNHKNKNKQKIKIKPILWCFSQAALHTLISKQLRLGNDDMIVEASD